MKRTARGKKTGRSRRTGKGAGNVSTNKAPAGGSGELGLMSTENRESYGVIKTQHNGPMLNVHMKLKKLGQDFVAYDRESKSAFKLDPLAFYVCSLCDGSNSTAQIAQKLESVLKENNLTPPVKDIGAEVEAVINALSLNGIVFVD